MDIDVEKLIQTALGNLDLKDFKGDVVGVKIVENEIGNIEAGGIGVQKNYYNTAEPTDAKVQGNEDAPKSEDNSLWTRIEEKLNLLPRQVTPQNEIRMDVDVNLVKKIIRNAINKDKRPLNDELRAQSEELTGWFSKRKKTADDRCFALSLFNILGYLIDRNVLPNAKQQYAEALYPNSTPEEIDSNKAAMKRSAIEEHFSELMENAITRARG